MVNPNEKFDKVNEEEPDEVLSLSDEIFIEPTQEEMDRRAREHDEWQMRRGSRGPING